MVSRCLFFIGRQSRIMLAMKGNGIPSRNQGQNFLPMLWAINPVNKGKKKTINITGAAIKTSMIFLF